MKEFEELKVKAEALVEESIFPFIPASQLTKKPPVLSWQIRGYMQKGEFIQLFGDPASGKSLIALDMAFSIAALNDWQGCDIHPCKVAYVCGEGFVGLSKRIKALESKYKTKRKKDRRDKKKRRKQR